MSRSNEEERRREQTPRPGSVPPLYDEEETNVSSPPRTPPAAAVKTEPDPDFSVSSSVMAFTPSPKRVDVITLESDDDEDGDGESVPKTENNEEAAEQPTKPRDLVNVVGPAEEDEAPSPRRPEPLVDPRDPRVLEPRDARRTKRPVPRFRQLSPELSSHASSPPRVRERDISTDVFAGSSELFNANKELPPPPQSQGSDESDRTPPAPPPKNTPERPRDWRQPTPAASPRAGAPLAVVAPIRRQLIPNQGPVNRELTPLAPLPPLPASPQRDQLDDSVDEDNNVTAPSSAVSSQSSAAPVRIPARQNTPAPAGWKRAAPRGYVPRPKRKKPPVKRNLNEEIERLQRSADFMIPKLAFSRLVRGVTQTNMDIEAKRWQSKALGAVQSAAESYLSNLFVDGYLCALHAKRVTLKPADIQVAMRLRPGGDPGKKRS